MAESAARGELTPLLEMLQSRLWAYVRARQNGVQQGLETAELAALLVQKYGYEMIDTAREVLGDAVATPLLATVDEAVTAIDPEWGQHARQHWAARPARLVTD